MDLARVDDFMAALLEVLVISDQIIRHPAIDLIYGETFNLFLRKSRILQIDLRNTLEVLFMQLIYQRDAFVFIRVYRNCLVC